MNEILLIIIAVLVFVLVVVFAYNMFQENNYRNKIRRQFGHSDGDALMGAQLQSVRDGHNMVHDVHDAAPQVPLPRDAQHDVKREPKRLKPSIVGKTPSSSPEVFEEIEPEPFVNNQNESIVDGTQMEIPKAEAVSIQPSPTINLPAVEPEPKKSVDRSAEAQHEGTGLVGELKATFARMLGGHEPHSVEEDRAVAVEIPTEDEQKTVPPKPLLIPLDDLRNSNLPWFDKRADYMAYLSLREGTELLSMPRLSNRYRFQMIGCTMDGLFQTAEPIPGVQYQAFAIGLQAISRNGLASERELLLFRQQVDMLAEMMDGEVYFENVEDFLEVAYPLDELCARVDQTIAIHLVSRVSILGMELRSALEDLGFQLLEEGSFGFADSGGDIKYTAVTLDGSSFTPSLLASQPYKGFSMLFDITRVPPGESNFDEFMNLAVRLSSILNLELVDDQIQQLSTEWLKEVRAYVLATQKEMLQADILPGSSLAQRLFT